MYAIGLYDNWQEQYVYEAFATELPAQEIQRAIKQLESVEKNTDSCVLSGAFTLVCAAVYTLKDLHGDKLYKKLLKDASPETRTFTREERRELIALLRNFKLEEHEVTKRIPPDVTPVFDASGKRLNDCYISLLEGLGVTFFWAGLHVGWPKSVRVESAEMDQSIFEKRLEKADPKLAERLLPLVDFDYSKGRCQKGMFGHISTGSRFYADDYVINRDVLREPFNTWRRADNGTVGLLLRIKDSRLCRDPNAVFALTAAHCVFSELAEYADKAEHNDQQAVELIRKFNEEVRYAQFDVVSLVGQHNITLDYALLRVHRAKAERLSSYCRGNLIDISHPTSPNDQVIKVGNASGITMGRFFSSCATMNSRSGVAVESLGLHQFMKMGDSGSLCCWFDQQYGGFVPIAILSYFGVDGKGCIGSDVFLCLQNYVVKNLNLENPPNFDQVNSMFEVYAPLQLTNESMNPSATIEVMNSSATIPIHEPMEIFPSLSNPQFQ